MKQLKISGKTDGPKPLKSSADLQRAAILAKRLFDLYPLNDLPNPEVFLASVVELFTAYPGDVVYQAVSPVTGLPAIFKFRPSIAEMKEFLEARMVPIRRREAQEAAERERAMSLPPPVDRSQRPSYEELKAKYGDWAQKNAPAKPSAFLSEGELKALAGDEWDKIPRKQSASRIEPDS